MGPHAAVLYHNDADGFGAAFACWTKMKDAAVYIPVQYGQPVPSIPDGVFQVFIVDFSYPRDVCEDLAARYVLTVLDHHKTAREALDGLPYAVFDMEKSGAVLAWEYMHPSEPIQEILQYVQDYDLWRFVLPDSRAVNLYIGSLPTEFTAWENFSLPEAKLGGRAIEAFRDAQVRSDLEGVFFGRIAGYIVPVLNLSTNVSETGNQMCVRYPNAMFSASYCDRADGKRTYSLRSVGDFDVSAIARAFGGGGHRNAAGFSVPIDPLVLSGGI